jgi:hypothetical protein
MHYFWIINIHIKYFFNFKSYLHTTHNNNYKNIIIQQSTNIVFTITYINNV